MYKVLVAIKANDGNTNAGTMRAARNPRTMRDFLTGTKVRTHTVFGKETAEDVADYWRGQTKWGRNDCYDITDVRIVSI